LVLQPLEYPILLMRKALLENQNEVVFAKKMGIDNKFMLFSKVKPYIEKRIREEPQNGELRLRYANFLRKLNEYDKAINEYTRALQLNSCLLGPLVNLCDIFHHRSNQYREKGAITKAKEYFERAVTLYESGTADLATILDRKIISVWIDEKRRMLYPGGKKRKSRGRKRRS
jgi:tetratricopeptide (TPR) repeat protein